MSYVDFKRSVVDFLQHLGLPSRFGDVLLGIRVISRFFIFYLELESDTGFGTVESAVFTGLYIYIYTAGRVRSCDGA